MLTTGAVASTLITRVSASISVTLSVTWTVTVCDPSDSAGAVHGEEHGLHEPWSTRHLTLSTLASFTLKPYVGVESPLSAPSAGPLVNDTSGLVVSTVNVR